MRGPRGTPGRAWRRLGGAAAPRLYKALPIAGGAVADVEAAAAPPSSRLRGRGRAAGRGKGLAWPAAPPPSSQSLRCWGRGDPSRRGGAETRAPGPPPRPQPGPPHRLLPLPAPEPRAVTGRETGEGGRGGPALAGALGETSLSVSRSAELPGSGGCRPSPARRGRELHACQGWGRGRAGSRRAGRRTVCVALVAASLPRPACAPPLRVLPLIPVVPPPGRSSDAAADGRGRGGTHPARQPSAREGASPRTLARQRSGLPPKADGTPCEQVGQPSGRKESARKECPQVAAGVMERLPKSNCGNITPHAENRNSQQP